MATRRYGWMMALALGIASCGGGNDCDELGTQCESCDGETATACMDFAFDALQADDQDTCAAALESFSCDDYAVPATTP